MSAINSYGEDFICEVVQVLHGTLSPTSVRTAQTEIEALSLKPGYSRTLLEIMGNESSPTHIRNAAAVALKNFVRTNWQDGDAPLPDEEREDLRTTLLAKAFQMPAFLRDQTSEIVCQISRVDFPKNWPRLIEVIASELSGGSQFDQLVAALTTLDQLVFRYRSEMRSDPLWLEIIFVVNTVAEPLTLLYQRMLKYTDGIIAGSDISDPLSPNDRAHWLQIMLMLTRIFHSLVTQDIAPYFEENFADWMKGFLMLLSVVLPPALEQTQLDVEPGDLERLKTEVCEVATLFSQRFEDLFGDYTRGFIDAIWQLLNVTDTRMRFDAFVNAALGFLAAICQRPHYKASFEAVLEGICQGVIIKNLMLRQEDIEIYKEDPFEFLKRDIEGSDLETRRRGATDFVRALCKQFEPQVFDILSKAINQFLEEYSQNPIANFAKKDLVYFLVSAMAARSSTTRHGSTSTSQLINVSDFYAQYVRVDLADGRPDERPILRGDALKFVVLFRSQLAPELIIECVSGAPPTEPPDPSRSIIRFLGSSHLILHHYVAYALERLLLLRFSGATIWHQNLLLTADSIPLGHLIESLFKCFELSRTAYDTHYIMKALMRCFMIINDELAKGAHIYVQRLAAMIEEAIRTPKNPLFMHYVFESLCVLIRKAYTKVEGGLDKHMIPFVEAILASEVATDFTAYAFQLIALLLDQSQTERQHGVAVDQNQYENFFPALFRPQFWARQANFPALVRIFEAFIRCLPDLVFQTSNSEQVLGVLQKLIGSKANDQHGFRLVNSLIPHLDSRPEGRLNSREIILTMLNRLNQSKTSKCLRQFAIFFFRYIAIRGGQALADVLNTIQPGLFMMVIEKLVLTEVRQMPQTTTTDEKRVVAIGAASLINETVTQLGPLYCQIVDAVVAMLEAFKPTANETAILSTTTAAGLFGPEVLPDESEGQQELEYSDPYSKLTFAQQIQPFYSNIQNIRKNFAQAVLVTAQSVSPDSLNCIGDRVKSCLQDYLNSA